MRIPGYYSSGQFAAMAGVTVRTIRFYDRQNILKPSFVNENGARFYTDSDVARLQQILLLKYLGFSLDEIREITISDPDTHFMINSLRMQKKLIDDRIEQMQMVRRALEDTVSAMEEGHTLDWSRMLELIHLTNMENTLAAQYRDDANISSRIRLHTLYSENRQGWFPWIFSRLELAENMDVLELGCGSGTLWTENREQIPQSIRIVLSDLSDGMVRDVRRSIGPEDPRFSYQPIDAAAIPYPDDSFDLVIANHVLFYCEDIPAVCREIRRVLRPGGRLICSCYGQKHMQEITQLVQEFDSRTILSADHLYERFGLENAREILSECFTSIESDEYPDALLVTKAEPLIEYILSCHGNQNQILLNRFKEFRSFVQQKCEKGFRITKQAGLFVCR